MKRLAGADVLNATDGRVAASPWPGACEPAGVGEQGTFTLGFSRNLGGPSIFSADPGGRYRVTNSRPMAGASGGRGSETRMRPGYRPCEGNEARRDGWGEAERRIVPLRRGNRPEGPRGGKEAPGQEAAGGKDAGDTEP